MIPSPGQTVLGRYERPRGERTKLAVLSDAHVTLSEHGTWKQYHRTPERFETALARATSYDIDTVVLAGDLSKADRSTEFSYFGECLSSIAVPSVAVPGNHDVIGSPAGADRSLERFVDTFDDGELPFVRTVGGVDLIGLNSTHVVRGTTNGCVPETQLDWLETTLETATTPIVVLHYPVTRSWEDGTGFDAAEFRLGNAQELAALLDTHGVNLVVSGHVHWPLAGSIGTVREVVSPAICSFPQGFLLIDVTPAGTTVSMITLPGERIQREAYEELVHDPPLEGYAQIADSPYLSEFPLVSEMNRGTSPE